MSECEICGRQKTTSCPHGLPLREMLNEVYRWRSDDFGHSVTYLQEAESRALTDIISKFEDYISKHTALLDIAEQLCWSLINEFDVADAEFGKKALSEYKQWKEKNETT